jgi:hypothetical protein
MKLVCSQHLLPFKGRTKVGMVVTVKGSTNTIPIPAFPLKGKEIG